MRDRIVLTSLRVAALALVLFCLFRPTLVVRAAVDQQNVVAVLLDDSRSMQIGGLGRASHAAEFLKAAVRRSPTARCSSRCRIAFSSGSFRFSSTAGARRFGRRI